MSVLLFGVSHRSAPVSVLEQLSHRRVRSGQDRRPGAAVLAGDRGHGAVHLQPRRGLRGCRRLPRRPVGDRPGALRAFRHGARRPDQVRLRPLRRGGRRAPVRGRQRPGFRGDRRTAGARPGAPRLRRRRGQPHRRPHPARAGPARAVGRQAGAHRDRHRRRGRVGGVRRAGHGRRQARTGWPAAPRSSSARARWARCRPSIWRARVSSASTS